MFEQFLSTMTSNRRPFVITITHKDYKVTLECHDPLGNYRLEECISDIEPISVKTKSLKRVIAALSDHTLFKNFTLFNKHDYYLSVDMIEQLMKDNISFTLRQPETLDDYSLKMKFDQGVINVTSRGLDYKYNGKSAAEAVTAYNRSIEAMAIRSYPKTWETKVGKPTQ